MNRFCIGILLIAIQFYPKTMLAQTQFELESFALSTNVKKIAPFSDSELKERVNQLPLTIITPKYNSVVKGYIHKYVKRSRDHTENILGKTAIYFPIFEEYLTKHGLPIELRCLPIVESALNPNAVSSANAVGLWQFMPETAKEQGLLINRHVDERRDPYRSTECAVGYLNKLFNRFDDWALALAAYNAGSGRVNNAIRRAKSNDFWKIRPYLPRETRDYVPAFIAALYVWNYSFMHNLRPKLPEEAALNICQIQVFNRISFSKIAEITKLSISIINDLNPAFQNRVIPASNDGFPLNIPSTAAQTLLNYLHKHDGKKAFLVLPSSLENLESPFGQFSEDLQDHGFWHRVVDGENLNSIAKHYCCTTDELILWNQLENVTIQENDYLIIFAPSINPIHLSPVNKLYSSISPIVIIDSSRSIPQISAQNETKLDYIPFYLQRGQSLLDITKMYPHLKLEDILEMNNLDGSRMPQPGDLLRLPLAP